jgi:phage gp29-like protein
MPDDTRKPVTTEVATVRKDIDLFCGWLGRLENPDTVLRYESQGKGVVIYEELLRDWQVFSQHQTRMLAIVACEWKVDSASDKRADAKVAAFVEQAFKSANYDKLAMQLMQAVITGYKPVEIMWEISEGDVWVSEFRGRRPSRFVFDMENRLRLLTLDNMIEGEETPERKFITWSYGGHDYGPYGRGLGHQLYWPVWFKKNGVKFWWVFCEKFGAPTPVGKYPAGQEGQRDTLLAAIAAIQQETGITIPEGMVIELLEAKRTGDGSYEAACEYMDRAISKILLGQTLTSEPGESGSYSLGQVHDLVRGEILKADSDLMCEAINNTVVKWLVDYNFGPKPRDGYPRVWRRTEPEADLKPLAERDKILLVDIGLKDRVPESYIEETYGITLAKEGEATIGKPEPPPSPGIMSGSISVSRSQSIPDTDGDNGKGQAAFAEASADDRAGIAGQANLDRLGDKAIDATAEELDLMLRPLVALVQGAQSYEEIGEKIFELYPRLDSARFQELLSRAMLAAGLTGAEAVKNEE